MKAIVISQPMFFPWVGIFEQMRLAEVFVHYDDVQFPQGRSFTNRVQIKTRDGVNWLTVPVTRKGLQPINEIQTDETQRWREKHVAALRQNYAKAPFRDEMLALVASVYALESANLSEVNIAGIESIAAYFGLAPQFVRSSTLPVGGASSARLLDLTRHLGGDTYITGHGARNYLDHELFERQDVRVEYIDYQKCPYPQLHGEFTPFVSALDLVANCGRDGTRVLVSGTVPWRQFVP